MWASPPILRGQQAPGGVRRLTDKLAILDASGSNIVGFSGAGGLVLVRIAQLALSRE